MKPVRKYIKMLRRPDVFKNIIKNELFLCNHNLQRCYKKCMWFEVYVDNVNNRAK